MQLQVELLTEQEMLAQAVEVKLQRLEPLPPHTDSGLIVQLKLDVDGSVDTYESDLTVVETNRRQPL